MDFSGIEDTSSREIRKMIRLATILAVCIVHSVWAAAPTGLSITVAGYDDGSDVTSIDDGKYYAVGGNTLAKLTCAASGGDPVEWEFYKEGKVVPGGVYFQPNDSWVFAVNEPGSGSYSCTARDSSRSVSTETPPFAILTIKGAAPPKNIEFTQTSPNGSHADVMDNDGKATAQLTCGADGSSNNFQFVKIEGSTILIVQEFGRINVHTVHKRTFDIKNFTNDDAGVYSCRAMRYGGIGFPPTDKTLYIGCSAKTECTGDDNAKCDGTPPRCGCEYGGVYSGKAKTCNDACSGKTCDSGSGNAHCEAVVGGQCQCKDNKFKLNANDVCEDPCSGKDCATKKDTTKCEAQETTCKCVTKSYTFDKDEKKCVPPPTTVVSEGTGSTTTKSTAASASSSVSTILAVALLAVLMS